MTQLVVGVGEDAGVPGRVIMNFHDRGYLSLERELAAGVATAVDLLASTAGLEVKWEGLPLDRIEVSSTEVRILQFALKRMKAGK